MKLYDIKEAYLNILELDLDDEALNKALSAVESELSDKANSIGCLIRTLEAEDSAYKAEIARFKALSNSNEKKIERIKKYLSETMQDMNVPSLSTQHFKFTFRKSESVNIDDEALISDEFKTEEIKVKISKTDIKKAIKSGQYVKGASLVTKQNLQIK